MNALEMPYILKIIFFLKYSVNAKECHGQNSFLEDLVTDQLTMPIEIGQGMSPLPPLLWGCSELVLLKPGA